MILPNDITNLKTDITDKIGQKIIVKGTLGRSRFFEKEATIYHNTSFVEEVIDLEEAGFVDINSYCQFENSIAFVYRNEHSKELLRFITRITLRDYKINNVELEFKDYAEEWFFRLPKKFNYELTPEEKYEINGEEKPMDLEDTQKPSRFRFN